MQRWLQATWKMPPPAAPLSSEAARLRAAYSLALRYCIANQPGAAPSMDAALHAGAPASAAEGLSRPQAHRDAIRSLPGLKLWLSGRPAAARPAAWVSLISADLACSPLISA